MRYIISFLLVASVGCGVKKAEHAKALNQVEVLTGELAATKKDLARFQKDNRRLGGKLEVTQKDRDANKKRNQALAQEMQATEEELEELRKQRAESEKRVQAFRDLNARFQSLVNTGKLEVTFRNGQMTLKLPSGVLFASGKGKLSKSGSVALQEVLNVLMAYKDRRFLIAGHTDNIPIRSKRFKDNWELSTARAVSVVHYMVGAGFPSKNLGAAGYGEFSPVANNDTKENRALNRRIEIVLVPDLSELPNLTAK